MAAGKYRDAVEFQRKTASQTRNRLGNLADPAWGALFSARGWLRETTGKERIAAGRLEAPATATLRVLTSPTGPAHGVLASDRVLARGATWKITGPGIDPDGLGRSLEFALERGGAVQ